MVCMTVRSVSCVRCISCGDFRESPRRQVSKTEGRGALMASGITPSANAGPRSVEACAHTPQGQACSTAREGHLSSRVPGTVPSISFPGMLRACFMAAPEPGLQQPASLPSSLPFRRWKYNKHRREKPSGLLGAAIPWGD